MKQLLYVSHSHRELSENELLEILQQARTNNIANNISGILLYHKNYFIQLLEGEAEDIDELYAKISKDARHQKINLIGRYDTPKRSFPEWSMGFKELSSQDIARVEGFNDIFIRQNGKSELLQNPTILVEMLATLFEIKT